MELLDGGDVSRCGAALVSVTDTTSNCASAADGVTMATLGGGTSVPFEVMAGM